MIEQMNWGDGIARVCIMLSAIVSAWHYCEKKDICKTIFFCSIIIGLIIMK